MTIHKWRQSIYFLAAILLTPVLFAQNPPGFPTQPMIIHGEVLVKGKNAEDGSVVEAKVDSVTVANAKVRTHFGFSSYVLEIKKLAWFTDYDRIKIVYGDYTALGHLEWKKGKSAKRDILSSSTIQNRATIKTAEVVKNAKGWQLQCAFDPLQQEGITAGAVKYQIRWYFTDQTTDSEDENEPLMIKEKTVASTETKQTMTLEPDTLPELTGYLHLVITPILNNGELGPSVLKKIKVELEEAEM